MCALQRLMQTPPRHVIINSGWWLQVVFTYNINNSCGLFMCHNRPCQCVCVCAETRDLETEAVKWNSAIAHFITHASSSPLWRVRKCPEKKRPTLRVYICSIPLMTSHTPSEWWVFFSELLFSEVIQIHPALMEPTTDSHNMENKPETYRLTGCVY